MGDWTVTLGAATGLANASIAPDITKNVKKIDAKAIVHFMLNLPTFQSLLGLLISFYPVFRSKVIVWQVWVLGKYLTFPQRQILHVALGEAATHEHT
jgi:hypothetical protein